MTGEEGYTVVGSEHYIAYRGHVAMSRAIFLRWGACWGLGPRCF